MTNAQHVFNTITVIKEGKINLIIICVLTI